MYVEEKNPEARVCEVCGAKPGSAKKQKIKCVKPGSVGWHRLKPGFVTKARVYPAESPGLYGPGLSANRHVSGQTTC